MAESTSRSGKPSEETEEDGTTITLEEFLEEEQRLEIDANAVLGPSDDKNCTYNLGHVKRQALYACMTCVPHDQDAFKAAGVCLACSYHCHEGHDLVELYTKRNFRCDCGNSRFKNSKCNLEAKKNDVNEGNQYNQNFRGLYCTCSRPYPDPDDTVPDEMLQCIICEDWYHTRHLESEIPMEENYAEMICSSCTDKLPFLSHYMGYAVTKVNSGESHEGNVDVCSGEDNINTSKISADKEEHNTSSVAENVNGINNSSNETKECILKTNKAIPRTNKGATFWPANFRALLCKCESCQEKYIELGVPWITDPMDTVQAYEDKGRQEVNNGSQASAVDQVLKILSGMDRFRQVEAIHNYNELKSHLVEYLTKFAQNKKVVREEDIHEFFSQMHARKRQRVDAPPYLCR